jgi:hypothetical protein
MRRVYADTVYWIALPNPLDQWHPLAIQAGRTLRGATIITSEEILTEFVLDRLADGDEEKTAIWELAGRG